MSANIIKRAQKARAATENAIIIYRHCLRHSYVYMARERAICDTVRDTEMSTAGARESVTGYMSASEYKEEDMLTMALRMRHICWRRRVTQP